MLQGAVELCGQSIGLNRLVRIDSRLASFNTHCGPKCFLEKGSEAILGWSVSSFNFASINIIPIHMIVDEKQLLNYNI